MSRPAASPEGSGTPTKAPGVARPCMRTAGTTCTCTRCSPRTCPENRPDHRDRVTRGLQRLRSRYTLSRACHRLHRVDPGAHEVDGPIDHSPTTGAAAELSVKGAWD